MLNLLFELFENIVIVETEVDKTTITGSAAFVKSSYFH